MTPEEMETAINELRTATQGIQETVADISESVQNAVASALPTNPEPEPETDPKPQDSPTPDPAPEPTPELPKKSLLRHGVDRVMDFMGL